MSAVGWPSGSRLYLKHQQNSRVAARPRAIARAIAGTDAMTLRCLRNRVLRQKKKVLRRPALFSTLLPAIGSSNVGERGEKKACSRGTVVPVARGLSFPSICNVCSSLFLALVLL